MKKKKVYNEYKNEIEIDDLVETNLEYYKPLFDKFEKEGKVKSFNLYALLFAPYWYIYRKMIFKGILLIGFQAILATFAYSIKSPLFIGLFLLSFLLYVRAGYYGNYDYYKNVLKLQSMGNTVAVKFRHKFMNDKSGVDLYMTTIWIFTSIALYAAVVFL
ncbi:DUF2628 domain-containing protein [Peptostreptococcus faecalis]|uniref:DUF2628 domain-containing protein n=1 Tax=Peptostreptococcus faecalis TaxID=2045015 RepID=UPI000C7C5D02|nr:DUF2628 domain-containing protein [Peptostreptococcus faecalis]